MPRLINSESGSLPRATGARRTARLSLLGVSAIIRMLSGSNSVVESRLPKPLVAGSIPVSRSTLFHFLVWCRKAFCQESVA